MKRTYAFGFLLALSQCFSHCIEPIDIEIPKGYQESIIVNGKLVLGDPAVFTLEVGQLFTFTSGSRGRIHVQEVLLFDSDERQMRIEPYGTGLFRHQFSDSDPLQPQIGKKYKVRIGLFDGSEFESEFEEIVPVPQIKEVHLTSYLRTTTANRYLRCAIDTDLAPRPDLPKTFLKWELEGWAKLTDTPIVPRTKPKVCYLFKPLNVLNPIIYPAPRVSASELEDHLLLDIRVDGFFGEGYYLVVRQEALDERAYQYWQNIKDVAESAGDFFSATPGKVAGNIRNLHSPEREAFGYFYVTKESVEHVYVSPEFAFGEDPVRRRCPSSGLVGIGGSCGDLLCCDCDQEENSTTKKPAFWIH